MNSGSPRARAVWRGIALLFAVSVVMMRLGLAGCSPALSGPTKAGGRGDGQPSQAGPTPAPPASKPAPAKTPSAAPPDPRLSDPAFFPPTKAAGGFYPRPRPAAPPPQQAAEPR